MWKRALLIASLWAVPVSAQTTIDLGSLNIPASRVPRWYPAASAEASHLAAKSWPEYDVTCECADDSCVADSTGVAGCVPAPGTIPFPNSWGCDTADPADDGGEDWAQIDCVVDNVPDRSVVSIPDGTYDMGSDSFDQIIIERNNVVIRGESNTGTHLVATSHDGSRGRWGWGDCSGGSTDCAGMVISVGAPYLGPSTPWLAGFDANETEVIVGNSTGFVVGGWILLEMVSCPALIRNPTGNSDKSLGHIAKITAIDGFAVTMDRGLRMDYDDDGCKWSAIARPYAPRSGVGIERLHITTHPNSLPLHKIARRAIGLGGMVESWIVGNRLERWEDELIRLQFSARNWIQGNVFQHYCHQESNFNTEGINLNRGAVDNVLENNYWNDMCVAVKLQGGAEGNVVAYNYFRSGTVPDTMNQGLGPEAMVISHGMWTREILYEGNDANHILSPADRWWGPNGPRNTVYRNRLIPCSGLWCGAVVTNRDCCGSYGDGSWNSGDQINIIGNHADYYHTIAEAGDFPDGMTATHDIDRFTTNMWIERNIYRDTQTCRRDYSECVGGSNAGNNCVENQPAPLDCPGGGTCEVVRLNACGFHMDTPEATTGCGTGEPGDCGGQYPGNNAGGASNPPAWDADVIPHSLYRDATPPSWWCSEPETCDWSDVHKGVGAWGDDFGGIRCKLPAQIMAEGDTCTPVVGGAPQ